ncbi:MAG: DNA double-strand break repair nuclease NurA [Pyrinomonadaceae bacterium]
MLYRQHLLHELTARREEFVRFERAWAEGARALAESLRALGGRTVVQIKNAAESELETGRARAAGALPSSELDEYRSVVVPFGERWGSHEAARAWAAEVLRGRATCAADGSQILPGREISVPVAAVQVASFENPHTPDGTSYRKEARFHLVTPHELTETGDNTAADVVGFRRFELELQALCEFCERHRGWRAVTGRRAPVAFFDGTLLLSSAQIRTESQFPREYIRATLDAVRLSRETEVPIVGFIDHSYARDLVHLLGVLAGHGGGRASTASLYDAQLFASALENDEKLLAAWGNRTIFFHCLREGLTRDFRDERDQPLVGFLYLQTTGAGAPARLDIPAWVYEAGLLEEVSDAVRAECVVGNGYPYALETADGAAVLTMQDREQFLRAVQDFAAEHDFSFRVSRKAVSKLRRR